MKLKKLSMVEGFLVKKILKLKEINNIIYKAKQKNMNCQENLEMIQEKSDAPTLIFLALFLICTFLCSLFERLD